MVLVHVTVQSGNPAVGTAPEDVPELFRRIVGRPPPAQDASDRRRSIFPTVGASPAGGVAFGALLSAHGAADGTTTDLSVLTVGASYSTKHRAQVSARLDQRFADNWRLVGDWRFYDFTEITYGLGTSTSPEVFEEVPLTWGRAHVTFYRTMVGRLSAGAGYHLDVRQTPGPLTHSTGTDPRTTFSSGPSLDMMFDSRDNVLNASKGWLARATAGWFPRDLGSTRSWQEAQIEGRAYRRLPSTRRQVVAFWGLAWSGVDGAPPYFDLPGIGWDFYGRTGRGYAAGRYRGRDWLYGEAEYRVDLMRSGLVGAVVFSNTFSFSDAGRHYGPWRVGGGVGLRIKLDKKHGSNLALDYAWGEHGSRGLFLALNEAF